MNRRTVFNRTLHSTRWIPVLFAVAVVVIQTLRITSKPTEYISSGKLNEGTTVKPLRSEDNQAVYESDFYGTPIGILESGELRHRALDRVRSLHSEIKEIDVKIHVSQTKGSSIRYLSAIGEEPKYTRVYLDALMDEYIAFRRDLMDKSINEAMNKVITKLLTREKAVKEKKDRLDDFLKTLGAPFLTSEHERMANRVSSLRGELNNLKSGTADAAKIQAKQNELTEAEKKLSEINEHEAMRKRLQDDYDHAEKDLQDWKRAMHTMEPSVMERPIHTIEVTPDLWVPLFVSAVLGAFVGVLLMLVIASIAAMTAAPVSSGPPPL